MKVNTKPKTKKRKKFIGHIYKDKRGKTIGATSMYSLEELQDLENEH